MTFNKQEVIEKTRIFFLSLLSKRLFELNQTLFEEFDPSSGLTLAVCITHASRAPWTLLTILLLRQNKKIRSPYCSYGSLEFFYSSL